MKTRTLGSSLEVSAVGLGCMCMSQSYGVIPDRADMIPVLRAAVDQGVTLFDTAEIYGPLVNEELVGEALEPVRNFLTGAIDENTTFTPNDFRNIVPRFSAEARKANQAVVDLVRSIAERNGATPAQVALAWLLAMKPWIVPIPGSTKLSRIEENIGAADVELTADELREIDHVASKIEIQGGRYPEALEARTGL